MAVPAYTTDLVDITLAESTTNWVALGGGASGLAIGPDFAMQGSNCVDKQVTLSEKGQVYNNTTTITPGANEHFFVWIYLATPGLAATLANRGLGAVLGTSTTAYTTFHVEGSDTYGAAGRVGRCYPIRYATTASAVPPYRTLTGTPGAAPQYFGATANITGTVKGSNLGVDAIRRGTGLFVTAGEIGNVGTFAGASAQNDTINNRWGIFTKIGASYELQGRFVIGQTSAGTPTAARFEDSNVSILIVDTPHSLTDFTQIIVDHASTIFNLTNITITAGGSNNKGRLVYNNASTVSSLSGCSFDGIDITTLRGGVTATSCTWRSAGQITQNSATISSCNITNSTATSALVSNNPGLVSSSRFTSAGTGHAIEITTPGSYTFSANIFTGYGADGTTNAAVYNNSGGAVTLNVVNGGTSPTIRNGTGATTTVIAGAVSATVTCTTVDNTPISDARVLVVASSGGPFPVNVVVTISNSGTVATVTHTSHGLATNDKVQIKGASLAQNNGVFSITVTDANTYTYTMASAPGSSPTGTIRATFVVLSGLTDAGGQITMSRVFPSDQPITGRVRKSSSQPYYKTGPIAGTVDSGTGFSTTVPLILDQ